MCTQSIHDINYRKFFLKLTFIFFHEAQKLHDITIRKSIIVRYFYNKVFYILFKNK